MDKPARTFHMSRGRLALSHAIWRVMWLGSQVLFRRKLIPHAEGLEYLPCSGPVLIVARHFHFFYDGYVLMRTVPRSFHTIVALDWLQSKALRLLIEFACSLPDWPIILRSERFQAHEKDKSWAYRQVEARRYLRQMTLTTIKLLRSGEILVMFPEGYPNVDPHPTPKADLDAFLPFRPGFVKLAELAERDGKTRVAIIPAGFTYTRDSDKRWQAIVRFGSPLFRSDFATTEQLVQAVEDRVHALSTTELASSHTSEADSL